MCTASLFIKDKLDSVLGRLKLLQFIMYLGQQPNVIRSFYSKMFIHEVAVTFQILMSACLQELVEIPVLFSCYI